MSIKLAIIKDNKLKIDGTQVLTEQQAVIAASAAVSQDTLTDSGGGTADGTVADQAAPVTLTDSSGLSGTHDDTVDATAAIVTLTDSSGLSGTHDDTVAATAAIVTLTDNTGGSGTHDDTLAAVTPAAAITDNSGGVDPADDTIAAIADPATVCQLVTLINVAAAAASADQLDIAAATGGETMANLVQPSHPRNIKLTFTDGDTSISAFQVTVAGTSPDGTVITEVFAFAGGLVQTGSKVFATLTSITLDSITGNGAGDTLDAEWGVKLGVPVLYGSTGLSIKRLVVDGTAEAVAATDTTNNSFTATTAPNGAHDYEVWYTVTGPSTTAMKAAIAQLAAKLNTANTAIGVLKQNQSDLAQKVIELVTREGVTAQNVSDVAQKVIELVTLAGTAQNNLKEITTELAKIKTDNAAQKTTIDAVVAMLKTHGLIASA